MPLGYTQLPEVAGLLLAGGVLLLWVCWKMWRELATAREAAEAAEEVPANADLKRNGTTLSAAPTRTFAQAATQILTADVSMSLDNVLAVAGAAHGHPT